jgi:hypothetical protein
VTDAKKPPPKPEGFLTFKAFLEKIIKVPKTEIDEKESEYRSDRKRLRKSG